MTRVALHGRTLLLAAAASMTLATSWPGDARADDPKLVRAAVQGHRKKPTTPATPSANATLHVTPAALGTSWTYEVTNSDTTPLRLVTDGRLLTLDVTPDEDDDSAHVRRAVTHCALPGEVRPTTDAEHVHVLMPGATYVEEFDPRLYCFDRHDALALTPGTHVVARLGWATTRGGQLRPPFIADESFGGDDRAGVKELVADSVITPDDLGDDEPEEHAHRLTVTAPARVDTESGRNLEIEVTVENTTSRPIHLMLRPETLAFQVASPKGVHECGWPRRPGAPIAEVFREIAPHGTASSSVLLASICPDDTFVAAGLYTVFTRIDTRGSSGKSIGIETFDGVVRAAAPTLVRVRHPPAPKP